MKPEEIDIADLNSNDITLDHLTPEWQLHQLRRGHRFSADDLLTAHFASILSPNAKIILDLGAGVGSVGLLTLWNMPESTKLVMAEAQLISHQLASKTIEHNKLSDRIQARRGDIRDKNTIPEKDHYNLVTGSPPYFPIGKALASPHPQRAACRMELRGNIRDYAKAARKAMKRDGIFVFCFPAGDNRYLEALAENSLNLTFTKDIIFREGLNPTISIYAATRNQKDTCAKDVPLCIRDKSGDFTSEYMKIRKRMGQPIY